MADYGDAEEPIMDPESGDDADPSLANRAQTACGKMISGFILANVAGVVLVYNVKMFSEQGGDFGGSHTQATIFGLACLGCVLYSASSYLCLSPLSDSIDAITDCVPCLPSFIEEMIDGAAAAMVGAASVLMGMFCTLVITGCGTMYYHPVAGGCMLGAAALLCMLLCCLGSQDKGERDQRKEETDALELGQFGQ